MWKYREYVTTFDSDKYDMVGGKLVVRDDYKKNIIEAELKGLESQKAYLQSQLNIFSDKLITIDERFNAKIEELEELE